MMREGASIGDELHAMATQLFPLHRAQSGQGVRDSLDLLSRRVPLNIREIASGTRVFDWTVPAEWRLRAAHVTDRHGDRVIDVARHTLHLVNGSRPIDRTLTWDELAPYLHALPDRPDAIPYLTAFFRDEWGFCLSHREREAMRLADRGPYAVVVDAELVDGADGGSMSYGECVVQGESDEEVLVWAHSCHPSLANDNLSGMCIAAVLARTMRERADPPRLTHRFVWAPATIGAIAWAATNPEAVKRTRHALVLSLLGDEHPLTCKLSKTGEAAIDRAARLALAATGRPHAFDAFVPWGYDERQFTSPGLDLPTICLMRSRPGEFAAYHTSDDDLSFIRPDALQGSFEAALLVLDHLDADRTYRNTRPFGEPRLGEHGLYRSLPEDLDARSFQQAVQWALSLGDGQHSLLAIAERGAIALPVLRDAAERLVACGLLEPVETG